MVESVVIEIILSNRVSRYRAAIMPRKTASGHRKHRGAQREKEGVGEPGIDELRYFALVGERGAHVAGHEVPEPSDVTRVPGQVENQLPAERGYRLRRRGLTENGLGEISGQQLYPDCDHERDGDEGDDAEKQSLAYQHRQ